MPPNLKTGKSQVSSATSEGLGLPGDFRGRVHEYNDTNPVENVVYPYAMQKQALLVVQPGQQMVLTCYAEYDTTKVEIYKVMPSQGVPVQGSGGCCPVVTIGRSIILRRAKLECWRLDKCNPVFVIKTPGYYEVEVSGDTSETTVTAVVTPLQEVNVFAQTAPCACG